MAMFDTVDDRCVCVCVHVSVHASLNCMCESCVFAHCHGLCMCKKHPPIPAIPYSFIIIMYYICMIKSGCLYMHSAKDSLLLCVSVCVCVYCSCAHPSSVYTSL